MKKFMFLFIVLLAGCQTPYTQTTYQPSGAKICYEYFDSFRCVTPTNTYNVTTYPKNESYMQYGYYHTHEQMSLSQVVYGTI